MASHQTIQLEAFNTDLHGGRILLHGTFPAGKTPPVMESVQRLRDPFKKKVLLTAAAFSFSKTFPFAYDAVFQAKDAQDWQLLLTYLTYAPKPLLVVAEDIPIPEGLWPKLNRSITFLHQSTKPIHPNFLKHYDAIFFAPTEETQGVASDQTYKILQSVYRPHYTVSEHKEIMNEVRVAQAGIVWSKVNEPTSAGALYWYDVTEHRMEEKITNAQLADLFGWLARTFSE